MDFIALMLAFAAGYAASVWSWPLLRQFLLGAEVEIAQLRRRARDLERKLRG